jgi:hypothetical protein
LRWCIAVAIALSANAPVRHLPAADLPTVSIEHLYYLRSRGEHIRRLGPEELIAYCVAHKLGGRGFDELYSQLLTMRLDLNKLRAVDELPDADARVQKLRRMHSAQSEILADEARVVQKGIVREGQIASETLESIGRAQQGR